MSNSEKFKLFKSLHVKGDPLVLYNIWDAGGAKALAETGARAIATGSWSVAAAHGYPDGEAIPLDFLLILAGRIAGATGLPLTVDFEGGYAEAPDALAENARRLAATGAVGMNFEDQVVGGAGVYPIARQAERIGAIRKAAGPDFFLNARTDLFLKEPDRARHAAFLSEAKTRAAAYAEAGASGFFVPGLIDPSLIAEICAATALPVNVMAMPGAPSRATLAELGAARISHGPFPYRQAMADLAERFRTALG